MPLKEKKTDSPYIVSSWNNGNCSASAIPSIDMYREGTLSLRLRNQLGNVPKPCSKWSDQFEWQFQEHEEPGKMA